MYLNHLLPLTCAVLTATVLICIASPALAAPPDWASLEKDFTEMPMDARRLAGPLFWLHGDDNETKDRLEFYLEKVAEGGNGSFCAESRPHSDWLGPRWYRDLDICLQKAKELDLKMWIFDDAWWPSQTMGKRVPKEYAAKRLAVSEEKVQGPKRFTASVPQEKFVALIAGKVVGDAVDGASLVDLAPSIKDGQVSWDAPAGMWQVMMFHYEQAPPAAQNGQYTVDGASQDCVDWFMETVYQPHYDRFKEDFGKTIVGYFYDEPETQGDWGTEVPKILAERGVGEKKALVAWKFRLAGDEQIAARYAYIDALFEAWGRTLYGTMTRWCEEHNVASIGHFMDHDDLYLKHGLGAGNIFQMQKYSSMGGMDLVCRQIYPGQRKRDIYQLPKMTSSISHAYNKADHLAMCEIYGAYGQDLTYPEMKWLIDQHQVRGVNFMISHSFNPKAPNDTDCPPYFYNDGQEPRWPLYHVWADYTSRLSLLLTGGRHVCPVAFLFCGNSIYAGKTTQPEDMTTLLQDALYDCDWLPYEVFEDKASVNGSTLSLYDERYRILVVPPVEVIPYETLAKVKDFFDQGGTVIGYEFLPTCSATIGQGSEEIRGLVEAVWGGATPGLKACRTNAAGGRSYFLPGDITADQMGSLLRKDAKIQPTLDVLEGDTGGWLHVLHRVKSEQDVFFICNQDHDGPARRFRFRAQAQGFPECWDAMRNEVSAIPHTRTGGEAAEFELTLDPAESVLIVFSKRQRALPQRIGSGQLKRAFSIPVPRLGARADTAPEAPLSLEGCSWVWYPEGDPASSVPPGTRYFRRAVTIPVSKKVVRARFVLSADNAFVVHIDGRKAGQSDPGGESWRTPKELDVTQMVKPGRRIFTIAATNTTDKASPAGLIGRLAVEFEDGPPLFVDIDGSWKVSQEKMGEWMGAGFDDSKWKVAKEVAAHGKGPWGTISWTKSRQADPFEGTFNFPESAVLAGGQMHLEMDEVHEGASIRVNGEFAGGVICQPFRINITKFIQAGTNRIEIVPFAPDNVRVSCYSAGD